MNFQIFKTKCSTRERIFVIFLTISLSILTFKTFYYSTLDIKTVIIYILLVLLICTLVFLAYYDFKKMEVQNSVSLILLLVLVVTNITLFFVLKDTEEIQLLNSWFYNPYNNILGAILLGSIFQLIVLLTKEKALGQGDVRIAIITGLIIGINSLIPWAYITVFSALIYGLMLSRKMKMFKGLKIPFLPFMILGIILLVLIAI